MDRWRRTPAELSEGIYDDLLTEALDALLHQLPAGLSAQAKLLTGSERDLRTIDAFIRSALDRTLDALETKIPDADIAEDRGAFPSTGTADDKYRYAEPTSQSLVALNARLRLATELLAVFQRHAPTLFDRPTELLIQRRRLEAVTSANSKAPDPPLGPLQYSQLLTNAPGEPLAAHLRSEFGSADRVDLLCAFLKVSGLTWLRSSIETLTQHRQRRLRILTTTYCGATEAKAVEELARMRNVEVRISYNTSSTRLHAKAWLFHRNSGLSTAYVGSSNLSHWAQTDGLEWNVRLTEVDQGLVIGQFSNAFEQYWDDEDQFERYDPFNDDHRDRLIDALNRARHGEFVAASKIPATEGSNPRFEIEARDFQKPILAELATARKLGRHQNLLVAATGTGKTIMAALDFKRLYRHGEVNSLLFVAHRKEILQQAKKTFSDALGQESFGELLVDGSRPRHGTHVFASIESLREGAAYPLDPSLYDMVIIDEAHHSAAKSWDTLLDRIRPKELLGLTGTPERADGIDYDRHFPRPWIGNLRIWNAIPHALVPFRYHALDVEGVDLSAVQWRNGAYIADELAEKLISAADIFVARAVEAIRKLIGRPEALRAIAFCSTIRHAEAVSAALRRRDLRAAVLTGDSDSGSRRDAQKELNEGRIQVLCVVDLYNEGVDVPNVNTIFFFRPTESATVFLQQLGRGLRRTPTKGELVVFDLTGRQHHEFRFDRRLRALLGVSPAHLKDLVENENFRYLPTGCVMKFEERARQQVLEQIRRAIPTRDIDITRILQQMAHREPSLIEFMEQTDIALEVIYGRKKTWLSHKRRARLAEDVELSGAEQDALANVHKLLHVGDGVRLRNWERMVRLEQPLTDPAHELYRRVVHMLFGVLYGKRVAVTDEGWALWSQHHALRFEIGELIPVLKKRNATLRSEPDTASLGWGNPLVLHAHYLGIEVSAAFNHTDKSGALFEYQTGVITVNGGQGRSWDLLRVTVNKGKSTKEHLRFNDFPLGVERFNWQSQARVTQASNAGRRHIAPHEHGCVPLLLVRDQEDVRPGVTMAHQYLGAVAPERFEGERPITIEWKLLHPMPEDVLERHRLAG